MHECLCYKSCKGWKERLKSLLVYCLFLLYFAHLFVCYVSSLFESLCLVSCMENINLIWFFKLEFWEIFDQLSVSPQFAERFSM